MDLIQEKQIKEIEKISIKKAKEIMDELNFVDKENYNLYNKYLTNLKFNIYHAIKKAMRI